MSRHKSGRRPQGGYGELPYQRYLPPGLVWNLIAAAKCVLPARVGAGFHSDIFPPGLGQRSGAAAASDDPPDSADADVIRANKAAPQMATAFHRDLRLRQINFKWVGHVPQQRCRGVRIDNAGVQLTP